MKSILDHNDWSFYLMEGTLKEISLFIPKLLIFILFTLIAWLLLKVILFILKKLLVISKIDDLAHNLSESELFNHINIKPSTIIFAFARFFLIMLIIIFGADFLGLDAVSREIGNFLAYIPQVFVAIIIFALGVYLSIVVKNFFRELLRSFGWSGSKVISNIISYIILIIVGITALGQAGINTAVITDNLSILLGAFLACFAIAIGLGSRDIVTRILYSFYSKKNYRIGQRIQFNGIEGSIMAIDNICIILRTDQGKLVIPIKDLVNEKVTILEP